MFFAFHLYALWLLAATFAGGLVWWADVLLAVGPLMAVAAVVTTARRPMQRLATVVNAAVVLAYVVLWAQLIPRLEWRGNP